jgi:peroxiredoxin
MMLKPALLSVAVALAAPALAAPQLNQDAPAFTAKTAKGETVSLSDYRGRTVVLEWTNKGCPYVQKHYKSGNMQALQEEAGDDGIVWLTVNSSAPGKQGHVTADKARAETAAYDSVEAEYLLDPEGRIGRAYGATATPHMYVIDEAGTLRYMGAIDDRPTADQGDIDGATNYVRTALAAMERGAAPDPAATRAYGCSVKYAD